MAVPVYNGWYTHYKIYSVTGGGTTWSADLSGSTTFDYFSDSAEVDDFIIFTGNSYRPWRNIQVNVGTAFAATSVTFVWEYWDGNSWETLTVTDGTGDWTNIGEQTISFDVTTSWRNNYTGNSSAIRRYYPIRCRISAIDTPTEGGANATSTSKAGDHIIWVNSGGTDYTMEDLYDADIAGSWGVITKITTDNYNVYKVACHFRLYSGNLTSQNEVVVFERDCQIQVDNFNLTLGEKVSDYTGKNGATWLFYIYPNYSTRGLSFRSSGAGSSNVNLYGSTIILNGDNTVLNFYQQYSSGGMEIIDCNLFNYNGSIEFDVYFVYDSADNKSEISNCRMVCDQVIFNFGAPKTFEQNQVSPNNAPLRANYGYSPTVEEVGSFGTPTYSGIYLYGYTGTFTVRNSTDIDLSDNRWQYTSYAQTGIVRDENSLEMTVQDTLGVPISGATVTVVDSNGDAIMGSPFTTDANGYIDCGYLLRRTATCGGTQLVTTSVSTMVLYTPHTVTISKTGYKTRTIIYTMDRKREEIEKLDIQADSEQIIALQLDEDLYQAI